MIAAQLGVGGRSVVADIFDGLTRGVPGMAREKMEAVFTEFVDPNEIAEDLALSYTPDKIFLGVIGGDPNNWDERGARYVQGGHPIGIADDRHMITIAGSRAGKGRSAIIPNMLRYSGSVLAIDPKGELAKFTAQRRAQELGQKVCVIDPFKITPDALEPYRIGFNPMAQLDKGSVVEMASLITDALVITEGERDPHWSESAKSFIESVVSLVGTEPECEGRRNLITVRDLLTKGEHFKEHLMPDRLVLHLQGLGKSPEEIVEGVPLGFLKFVMEISEHELAVRGGADFFEKPPGERSSVHSSVRRHLRVLNYPEIETSLSGEGVQLAELRSRPEGMTIYLCLPARHLGTCGPWLRLFINLALQAMERAGEPDHTKAPVLFLMDEFASAIGHLKAIEDAAGQIAGFGVKLWPILQDLGQLKDLYKGRWETFMANAGVLQFFGNNDLTTLEWVSKRVGSTTLIQKSKQSVTIHAGAHGQAGDSFSPRTTPVLEPEEVAKFFARDDSELRQLIMKGPDPMILQRAFYDQHEAFTP